MVVEDELRNFLLAESPEQMGSIDVIARNHQNTAHRTMHLDLASSPLADELRALGAFRADVSGAGPTVYGLFHHRRPARAARRALKRVARTWLTAPAWYG